MAEYAFGIDVGGTTVKCGLFNVKGDLLEKWEIPTRKEDGGKYILGDIADAIKDKCRGKGLKKEDILGVGIGVPGPVLEDGIVNNCVNLGWGVVDVKETLSGLLDGIPVAVGNDANVAALGEQWKGGGSGYKNVVLVTLGTGVGGGIIIGGKIMAPTVQAVRSATSRWTRTRPFPATAVRRGASSSTPPQPVWSAWQSATLQRARRQPY